MKNYTNCPICKSTEFSLLKECKDYTSSSEIFKISACNSCGFAFTNPIPEENEIGKYYESDEYISHSNTSKGIINKLYQFVRNITLDKKVNLLKSLTNKRKLLDIGSGTGEFLNHTQKNGFTVQGIEPSLIGRNNSIKNFNLSVYPEKKLAEYSENEFDIITMWHVLEHVYHLNERVETIHRILKKDGYLIVAVPNRLSYDAEKYQEFWAAYDVPRHLYHFRPVDIKTLFENHSFDVKQILPMKFDSFYVSMLSEKYKNEKSKLFKAFLIGLKSNMKSKGLAKFSSQIYILQKKG
tara:strand:+ start:174 stop:1058 length:885 start_codon:yes stop_codon:yes gene_type:complete